MRLSAYRPGDEWHCAARADFRADLAAAGGCLPPGRRLTLTAPETDPEREAFDEAVLAVAGFTPLGPGQLGAWAYAADLAPRQWVRAARLARACCGWACALLDVAIYATPADSDAAQRLLAYIGFRPSPDDAGVWKFMGEAS